MVTRCLPTRMRSPSCSPKWALSRRLMCGHAQCQTRETRQATGDVLQSSSLVYLKTNDKNIATQLYSLTTSASRFSKGAHHITSHKGVHICRRNLHHAILRHHERGHGGNVEGVGEY